MSLEHWEAGSIPDPAQWARDLALPQLHLGCKWGSDLILGLGTPCALGWPTKEKEKKKPPESLRLVLEIVFYWCSL